MPVCRHSRYAGMDYVNHWIPACAGRLRASMPSRRIQDFLSINDGGSRGSGIRQA